MKHIKIDYPDVISKNQTLSGKALLELSERESSFSQSLTTLNQADGGKQSSSSSAKTENKTRSQSSSQTFSKAFNFIKGATLATEEEESRIAKTFQKELGII